MAKLICISILLAVVSQSLGFRFWNNLRATWSMPVGPIENFRYDQLPRTEVDAVKQGWEKLTNPTDCHNDGDFNGFRYLHPEDSGVALLFDTRGHVGGIQALLPHNELIFDGNFEYGEVPMFQNATLNNVNYFVVTAYFVHPDKLCSEGDYQSGNIGEHSQLYFQNGRGVKDLKVGYKDRDVATANGWSLNQCIPGMGRHNFYAVENYADHDCKRIQPTCLLFDEKNELHGFCLTFSGMGKSKRFEHPDKNGVAAAIGPMVPQCLLDSVDNFGATTIHIYFNSAPWLEQCKH